MPPPIMEAKSIFRKDFIRIYLVLRLYSNIKYLFSLRETKREAHLLLGGNLGDVRKSFVEAERILGDSLRIIRKSSLYESEPWGMESTSLFLNQVWIIETQLEAEDLLDRLLATELELGRKRPSGSQTYQDRLIDIDILFMGNSVIRNEKLELPHPRLHLRAFTLQALAEVDAEFRHPTLGQSIGELLEKCEDNAKARKLIGG